MLTAHDYAALFYIIAMTGVLYRAVIYQIENRVCFWTSFIITITATMVLIADTLNRANHLILPSIYNAGLEIAYKTYDTVANTVPITLLVCFSITLLICLSILYIMDDIKTKNDEEDKT